MRNQTTKANSYYYIANKTTKVQGQDVVVFEGNKGVWYSSERRAKDSWLPEPLEDILAKIVG